MKYMNFNSSCSYACLAELISEYNLNYDDFEIVKEMNLISFFDKNNENIYISGAMLQGKKWFDLFLYKHDLEFQEESIRKENIENYLLSLNTKVMFGITEGGSKHSVVYYPEHKGSYKLMNPHYVGDKLSNFYILSITELIQRLEENVIVGKVVELRHKGLNINLFSNSKKIFSEYIKDLKEFFVLENSFTVLMDNRERLFTPLLISIHSILKIENKLELVSKIERIKKQYLRALEASKIKNVFLFNYIDEVNLEYCLEEVSNMLIDYL